MPITRPGNAVSYEEDLVAWLDDQARRAREGKADGLDLENIAEELEGMARSDRREIRNRLIVLLIHLLKYSAQPKKRSSDWLATIGEQRSRIATVIDDSPSLKSFPGSILEHCHVDARSRTPSRPGYPKPTCLSVVHSGWIKCWIRAGFLLEPARAAIEAIAPTTMGWIGSSIADAPR
jgi:hypothetical protein